MKEAFCVRICFKFLSFLHRVQRCFKKTFQKIASKYRTENKSDCSVLSLLFWTYDLLYLVVNGAVDVNSHLISVEKVNYKLHSY